MTPQQSFDDLTKLPNIGKVLAQRLIEVGITSQQQLHDTGFERAFLMLQAVDPGACIQELHAVAGADWGIRSNDLTKEQKESLKVFFTQSRKNTKT
jgi:DNA transformation protein and related proteins